MRNEEQRLTLLPVVQDLSGLRNRPINLNFEHLFENFIFASTQNNKSEKIKIPSGESGTV